MTDVPHSSTASSIGPIARARRSSYVWAPALQGPGEVNGYTDETGAFELWIVEGHERSPESFLPHLQQHARAAREHTRLNGPVHVPCHERAQLGGG